MRALRTILPVTRYSSHFLRGETAAMGAGWVHGDADKSSDVLRSIGTVRGSYDASGGDVCDFSYTRPISLLHPLLSYC
jgi:hypothetical protein